MEKMASWDTFELWRGHVQDIMENIAHYQYLLNDDFQQIFDQAGRDSENFLAKVRALGLESELEQVAENEAVKDVDRIGFEWDSLIEMLTEDLFSDGEETFYCQVENFGWRNMSGHSVIHAETAAEFLSKLLPQCECTWTLYKVEDGLYKLQNAHHDSPTGNEWYTIENLSRKVSSEIATMTKKQKLAKCKELWVEPHEWGGSLDDTLTDALTDDYMQSAN